MFVVLLGGDALVCWYSESAGNPRVHALGVAAAPGNMEGKEVRFGVFNSAACGRDDHRTTCGAVNSMHDSFTPLGGLVPLINMQLGEVIFGGVGSGLYGMLVFVVRRDLHRRPDGRPHARVPGQEDRGVRREARRAGGAGDVRSACWCHRLGVGQRVGAWPV